MHQYLENLLEKQCIDNPDGIQVRLTSQISRDEGLFLQELIREIKPEVSLEIGLAYGVSSMFLCEELQKVGTSKHIVIDPGQRNKESWNGLGLYNLEKCGYGKLIEFWESSSEIALPKLLESDTKIDFAFIDGWHTFDHCLLDFFYINRMLNVGGLVVFDDANYPGIDRVIQYVLQYPCYRLYKTLKPSLMKPKRRMDILKNAAIKAGVLGTGKPRCVALQKIAEDKREWNWFKEFCK